MYWNILNLSRYVTTILILIFEFIEPTFIFFDFLNNIVYLSSKRFFILNLYDVETCTLG